MRKAFFAMFIGLAFVFQIPSAQALSCLPVDMHLESVIENPSDTQVFIGTASEVKNHTQVITVTEALQGWIAPKVWVTHPWSKDWQYYCSNGPAKVGESTVFFVTVNDFGQYSVVQTLSANSELAKDFIADIEAKKDVDAGITEAKASDRAAEMMQSITDLITMLSNMFVEWHYWQSQS